MSLYSIYRMIKYKLLGNRLYTTLCNMILIKMLIYSPKCPLLD